jgi:hypothetical protein
MTGRENEQDADREHQDQDAEPTTMAPDDAAPDVPTGEGGSSDDSDR